jgi:hypothetical protein
MTVRLPSSLTLPQQWAHCSIHWSANVRNSTCQLACDVADPDHAAAAGEYSAERLAELQKHTQRIPTSKASGAGSGAAAGDGIIRLQGSFKPAGAPKDDRFTMPPPAALVQPSQQPPQHQQQQQQMAADDDGDDDDMMLPPPPRPGGKPGAASSGAAPPKVLLHDDEDGEDGMIPDKEAIR